MLDSTKGFGWTMVALLILNLQPGGITAAALFYSNDLTYMSPGWGYWVKVSANHTWQVDYMGP